MHTRPLFARLYFDGACQPNPGEMQCAYILKGSDGKVLEALKVNLGMGTNNIDLWDDVAKMAYPAERQPLP